MWDRVELCGFDLLEGEEEEEEGLLRGVPAFLPSLLGGP